MQHNEPKQNITYKPLMKVWDKYEKEKREEEKL